MKKLILSLTALSLYTGAAQAIPVIATKSVRPACYELPNTAVPAALADTERKARITCTGPVQLIGVEVKIQNNGGCTPVTVSARYLCR